MKEYLYPRQAARGVQASVGVDDNRIEREGEKAEGLAIRAKSKGDVSLCR